MDRDPLRTAWFRFEQISPLLDTGLAASERRRLMETMSTVPVVWPSGTDSPGTGKHSLPLAEELSTRTKDRGALSQIPCSESNFLGYPRTMGSICSGIIGRRTRTLALYPGPPAQRSF